MIEDKCPECNGILEIKKITNKKDIENMGIEYKYVCKKCKETFYNITQIVSPKISNKLLYDIINKYGFSIKELSLLFGRPEKKIKDIVNNNRIMDNGMYYNIIEYFIDDDINEFIEKYKDDIPNDYYNLIKNKINLYK